MALLEDLTSLFGGLNTLKQQRDFETQKLALESKKIQAELAKATSQAQSNSAKDALARAKIKEIEHKTKLLDTEKLGVEQDTLGKKIENLQNAQENTWDDIYKWRSPSAFIDKKGQPKEERKPQPQGVPQPQQRSFMGVDVQPSPSQLPGLGDIKPAPSLSAIPQEQPPAQGPIPQGPVPQAGALSQMFGGQGQPTQPMPSIPPMGQPPAPPATPQYRQYDAMDPVQALEARNQYAQLLDEALPEFQRSREIIAIATEERDKMASAFMNEKFKILAKQKELADNPPTFKRALNNLNWGQKIGGLIFMLAESGKSFGQPTAVLDNMIAKEVNDLKVQHEAQGKFLDKADNLYSQFYDMTKDKFTAEMQTATAIRQNALNMLQVGKDAATNQEAILNLQTLETELHNKVLETQALADQKTFENKQTQFAQQVESRISAYNRAIEQRELAVKERQVGIKEREVGIKELKAQGLGGMSLEDIEKGLKIEKLQDERLQRTLKVGDFTARDLPTKDLSAAKKTLTVSKGTFRNIPKMEKLSEELTAMNASKSLFAGLPLSKFGEKEKRIYETLNMNLIQAMLKERINFTGGGNMSEQEQRYMRSFYKVKEDSKGIKKFLLGDTPQTYDMLKEKWKGGYKTLFNILKKDAFDNALGEAQKSFSFELLPREQQIMEVAKQLGLISKKGNWTSEENRNFVQDFIAGRNYLN